jgi:hypothetical protein
LAGLWRDDLPTSLLWSRSSALLRLSDQEYALLDLPTTKVTVSDTLAPYLPRLTTSSSDDSTPTPPTWSSASLRAGVDYNSKFIERGTRLHRLHQQAVILRVETTLVSKRYRTASVSSGLLSIYGYLKKVRLVQHERRRKTLLHRCRVTNFACAEEESTGHKHTPDCMEVNESDWAVLDLPPVAKMEETRCWRLRLGVLPPPHDIQFDDFGGDFVEHSDHVSQTYEMQYFMLLIGALKRRRTKDTLSEWGCTLKVLKEEDICTRQVTLRRWISVEIIY